MKLVDAYALVALIADERAADEVEGILRGGDAAIVIVNLAEAIDVSRRSHGFPIGDVREILEPLLGEALVVLVSAEREAWLATELRTRHYSRKTSALSLADCLLLAHALVGGDQIATSDAPLADAGRAEGVAIIALPDSTGVRP